MPLLKLHDDGFSGGGSWALSAVTSLTWPVSSRKYFNRDAHLLVSFCEKVLTLNLHPFASSIVNEQVCQSSLVSHSGKSSFWDYSILVFMFLRQRLGWAVLKKDKNNFYFLDKIKKKKKIQGSTIRMTWWSRATWCVRLTLVDHVF